MEERKAHTMSQNRLEEEKRNVQIVQEIVDDLQTQAQGWNNKFDEYVKEKQQLAESNRQLRGEVSQLKRAIEEEKRRSKEELQQQNQYQMAFTKVKTEKEQVEFELKKQLSQTETAKEE